MPESSELQESKVNSRDVSKVSEIQPPALLLQDNQCEWDSMLELDITRDGIDPTDLEMIQRQFADEYGEIRDSNQKILFRQYFAIQHKINSNLLKSNINTASGTAKKVFHSHNPSRIEEKKSPMQQPLLSSLAETAKQEHAVIKQKHNGAYAAFP